MTDESTGAPVTVRDGPLTEGKRHLPENPKRSAVKRRRFLAGAGAAGLALTGATVEWRDLTDGALDGKPARGEGEPVDVERTVRDDDLTYLPDRHAVRYPKYVSGDEVTEYGVMPFPKWASLRGASVATEVVVPAIEDRLGRGLDDLSWGASDDVLGMVVELTYYGDRDGTGDDVGYDRLVEAAPRYVEATVTFSGRSHAERVPVVVDHSTSEPSPW